MFKHPSETFQRRSGSVIVLVVVMLVLMAMIGATYLQVARTQRQIAEPAPDNMDAVLASIQQLITQQLIHDTFGETSGLYYDVSEGVEPYDRAWTNPSASSPSMTISGQFDGANAQGGFADDVWLSDTSPVFVGGTWEWRKLTSLTGRIYDQSTPTTNAVRLRGPDLDASLDDSNTVSDLYQVATHENLPVYGTTILGDATGDGIPDSFCERAPLTVVDGIEYFMWVKIVDLSSMANVNTAMVVTDQSGIYQPGSEPRPFLPTELNLSDLLMGNDPTLLDFNVPAAEVTRLMEDRGFMTGGVPTQWFQAGAAQTDRVKFWRDAASMRGNIDPTNVIAWKLINGNTNEAELRHRGGALASDDINSVFDDMANPGPPDFLTNGDSQNVSNDAELTTYLDDNPRIYLTTASAEADFAPPLPGENTTERILRLDINAAWRTPALHQDLIDLVNDVYAVGTTFRPGGLGSPDLGEQFLVNLIDYADADNRVTMYQNRRLGMEPLPYISEVLTQTLWSGDVDAMTGIPVWALETGEQVGFAIEITNPYPFPLQLSEVYLYFDNTDQGDLATLAGTAQLAVGESVVLYADSSSGSGDHDVEALIDTSGITRIVDVSSSVTFPDWSANSSVIVSLHATLELPDGTAVPANGSVAIWGYSGVEVTLPATAAIPDSDALPGLERIYRMGHVGNGGGSAINKINAILTDGPDFVRDESSPSDSEMPSYVDFLGENDKTAGGPADKVDPTLEQFFFNQTGGAGPLGDPTSGGIRSTTEAALLTLLGPDLSTLDPIESYASTFGASPSLDFFRLLLSANPNPLLPGMGFAPAPKMLGTTAPGFGSIYGVPHGVFLLNRLTVLSPAFDNRDNDGDGFDDNDGEQVIAGRINLNTASEALLAQILPIPDPTTRLFIANFIVTERDNPTRDGADPDSGLAHTMELIDRLGPIYLQGAFVGDTFNGQTGERLDMLSNPGLNLSDETDDFPDLIGDDREEALLPLTWLNEVATTRSDVYVAYVLVKGYRSSPTGFADVDGNDSPDPVEVGRAIYMFDRSGLIDSTGDGRVIISELFREPK